MPALYFLLCLLLASCASVRTEGVGPQAPLLPYPPRLGESIPVQLVRLSVPAEWAAAYPRLAEQGVGLGLYQRVATELSSCGHFTLLSDDTLVQTRILQQWALSQSGLYAEIPVSQGLAPPRYLVYAELFDFSIGQNEEVRGFHSTETAMTRVGIQLRFVDTRDGTYIPASGLGTALTSGDAWFTASSPSFSQTTVGIATGHAIHQALAAALAQLSNRSHP